MFPIFIMFMFSLISEGIKTNKGKNIIFINVLSGGLSLSWILECFYTTIILIINIEINQSSFLLIHIKLIQH